VTWVLVIFFAFEAWGLITYGPRTYMRRWLMVLVSIDQLANAYRGGDPDETLSSVAAKNARHWGWHKVGLFLEWIDPGHLKRYIEHDEGKHAPWW